MFPYFLLIFLFLKIVVAQIHKEFMDLGAPDYKCDSSVMVSSKTKPKNVNALRPGDIDVIMALGDSLTAGNGAKANDIFEVLHQYRGVSFTMGGDKSLDKHITIPNILKKFNHKLFGQSHGEGLANKWNVSQCNMAFPGAKAKDLPNQALRLVKTIKEHPNEIDLQNDWKLLNVFVGGNDLCAYCKNKTRFSSENYVSNIKKAIEIVKRDVPRVLVNLIIIFHIDLVRQLDSNSRLCKGLHLFECSCEDKEEFNNNQMKTVSKAYQMAQKQLETSGIFESDDFTLVTQPFLTDVDQAPRLSNGFVNMNFFAPDCFHFSELGHAVAASWVWKNMMEPVGKKITKANLSDAAMPLACPDVNCPYIRTVKNSQNCKHFVTPGGVRRRRTRSRSRTRS